MGDIAELFFYSTAREDGGSLENPVVNHAFEVELDSFALLSTVRSPKNPGNPTIGRICEVRDSNFRRSSSVLVLYPWILLGPPRQEFGVEWPTVPVITPSIDKLRIYDTFKIDREKLFTGKPNYLARMLIEHWGEQYRIYAPFIERMKLK
ncbi:hypothetical protein GF386_06130 [Candidatus Pacearchaeota archaeon]|nr:hypothetical protein [Candidatus Pacearchaeota archaeon]MBD3283667.1 hypothetical protein [Candidatus Pacearchaeota archaeon]